MTNIPVSALTAQTIFALLGMLPALFIGLFGRVPSSRQEADAAERGEVARASLWAGDRGRGFWTVLVLALVGTSTRSLYEVLQGWNGGLGLTLWVSISASLALYIGLCLFTVVARRLMGLLLVYLFILGLLAAALPGGADNADNLVASLQERPWLFIHIIVGVFTYGLLTLSAVSGLAALIQDRALKRKKPTPLSRRMPSVAEGEALTFRLLMSSEVILGLGFISGIVLDLLLYGQWLVLDHKTLLSFAAFVTIGGLIIAHHKTGVRGKVAARFLLLAYLLLTLAYPGVKFVTDVLLSA